MINQEKFKTTEERVKAFTDFCTSHGKCSDCPLFESGKRRACEFKWLDLEAEEEKPLPCPFCGEKCELHEIWGKEMCRPIGYDVRCSMCEYRSPQASKYDGSDAIAAHNRVCRAVMDTEKE